MSDFQLQTTQILCLTFSYKLHRYYPGTTRLEASAVCNDVRGSVTLKLPDPCPSDAETVPPDVTALWVLSLL